MQVRNFDQLLTILSGIRPVEQVGRIAGTEKGLLQVTGLAGKARLADRVRINCSNGRVLRGEIVSLGPVHTGVLVAGENQGLALGDPVVLLDSSDLWPHETWIGRVIDPDGIALDGRPLARGDNPYPLRRPAPDAATRRALGARLETGQKLFNTILPLVQGQRIGLYAGSGVGKSTLLGNFARNIQADVVVVGLVGERGRELRDFVENTMGPRAMARTVVIAATSDHPALVKRRAAHAAMAVAEFFRDSGKQVLLVIDSITRFAESHREVALAAGESAALRGFPPSTGNEIAALCERAGPGWGDGGDITAVISVLVAGSDMDEPIADITRGVLDGHIVMDRAIAERGRFPAVDVLRSVSRSLPKAATAEENALIQKTRAVLGAYEASELMIKAGLYTTGTDAQIDQAISLWPGLDAFAAEKETGGIKNSFSDLANCLGLK